MGVLKTALTARVCMAEMPGMKKGLYRCVTGVSDCERIIV